MATLRSVLRALEAQERFRRSASRAAEGLERFGNLRERERLALTGLLDKQASDESKRAAAAELTAITWNRQLLSPKPSARGVFDAANRQAREVGVDVRQFIVTNLQLSFLGAAKDVDRLQTVRVGKDWIKDDRGKKKPVRPRSLPRHQLIRWLRKTAFGQLKELIGYDEPRGRRADVEVDRIGATATDLEVSPQAKGVTAALLDESQVAVLSPRERQVLGLLQEGDSDQEIARRLGIVPSTVRVLRFRLNKKLHSTRHAL